MRRTASLAALIVAAALCAAAAGRAESDGRKIRVLAVGASHVVGLTAPPDAGPGFVEILARELRDTHEFVNVAVGGTISRDWTLSDANPDRFGPLFARRVAPNLPVPLVVLMLGLNDAIGRRPLPLAPPTPTEVYDRSMREIVREMLDRGAGRILLLTPVPHQLTVKHLRIAAYRERLLRLCRDFERVSCATDAYQLLGSDAGDLERYFHNLVDVHVTPAGHAAIAADLLPRLRAATAELAAEDGDGEGMPGPDGGSP